MTKPLRIACANAEQIPSVDFIRQNATWEQHVVLEMPEDPAMQAAKTQQIATLAAQLPDYSVFDSGGSSISVLRVVSEAEVLRHHAAILDAAQDFRRTATYLAHELAGKFGVLPSELRQWHSFTVRKPFWSDVPFLRTLFGDGIPEQQQIGLLANDWQHFFHGYGCCFSNSDTGQVVDVRINFNDEFGVLDPQFFLEFVQTTPAHQHLVTLLRDYHSCSRALKVMERHGFLRRISTTTNGFTGEGLVAA